MLADVIIKAMLRELEEKNANDEYVALELMRLERIVDSWIASRTQAIQRLTKLLEESPSEA